jgi:hypothetical protein
VVGSSRITTEGLAIIAQPVAAVASANTNEQSQVIVNLRQKQKKTSDSLCICPIHSLSQLHKLHTASISENPLTLGQIEDEAYSQAPSHSTT